jgi:hypothetical protein
MEVRVLVPDDPLLSDYLDLPDRLARAQSRALPSETERRQAGAPLCAAEGARFLAVDGGFARARCAAFVSPDLAGAREPTGLIGYFESEDDERYSGAALEAARTWLRQRGLRRVWGPMNCDVWRGYRFLTRGFERIPFAGEPRNPGYYATHFLRHGFRVRARWHSWDLERPQMETLVADAARRRSEALLATCQLIPLRAERLTEDLRRLHPIVMVSFRQNLAFTPLPLADFIDRFRALAPRLVPGMGGVIASPGGDVGFYLGYRESNETAEGVVDYAVFYAVGVLPEARKSGMIPRWSSSPSSAPRSSTGCRAASARCTSRGRPSWTRSARPVETTHFSKPPENDRQFTIPNPRVMMHRRRSTERIGDQWHVRAEPNASRSTCSECFLPLRRCRFCSPTVWPRTSACRRSTDSAPSA